MKGLRKFTLTVIALVAFTFILTIHEQVDPFWLGFGLGLLLTPTAFANVFEHLRREPAV